MTKQYALGYTENTEYTYVWLVPATELFPALHQDELGCGEHWPQVHHPDRTMHKRNQAVPELERILTLIVHVTSKSICKL